ncbi:MAG: hypothetical protein GY913_07245 [Proteobacteria bacterium]|nr:hypothetical protein [Pseudomonadota bacterium]MCP4916704.1 hypothetical protein [Pseudomonadota bacterium]
MLLLLACTGSVEDPACPTWFADADGDGFGGSLALEACEQPEGFVDNDDDCDDGWTEVHPGVPEWCNGVDDDCDGEIDEDVDITHLDRWYLDADGDGWGAGDPTGSCSQPAGHVLADGDCDDSNAERSPDTAWHEDRDADGYGATDYVVIQCDRPDDHVLDDRDCDDGDAEVNPGATEVCDSRDNDCDGLVDDDDDVDESTWLAWYDDTDGDGYGAGEPLLSCVGNSATVDNGDDCDDTDADVNPGEPEICDDGLDNDCSGDSPECGFVGEVDVDDDHDIELDGESSGDNFGFRFEVADIDGDGVTDLLAGSPYNDEKVGSGGAVHLFLGPLTSQDAEGADAVWYGPSSYAGWDVGHGDFDGDGTVDLLIGQGSGGSAYLVYGAGTASGVGDLDDAATFTGPSYVGSATGPVGDRDGDGVDDFAVSSPADGELWIYADSSPWTGALDSDEATWVVSADADAELGRYGHALTHGDLDGDGADDLVVGGEGHDGYVGGAWVFLGGSTPGDVEDADLVLAGTGSSDHFGHAVRVVEDLDGDGLAELLVGATYAGTGGVTHVFAYGPTSSWAAIDGGTVSDALGWSVDAGDVTGEGDADLLVGARTWESGSIGVYSQGAAFAFFGPISAGTWAESDASAVIAPAAGQSYQGTDVAIEDVDGDGVDDAVTSRMSGSGAIHIFLGGGL